jgi:uncharacterized protein
MKLNLSQQKTTNPIDFYEKISREVLRLFLCADQDIARFANSTGMQCVPGCGHCCESVEVEATVLELIPWAMSVYQMEDIDNWIRKASDRQFSGQCIFYQPDENKPGQGRCAFYQYRPLECRLFGFAAVRNKQGKKNLVTCAFIKKVMGKKFQTIAAHINEDLPVVMMPDYVARLSQIDYGLGVKLFPINHAIIEALQRLALLAQYLQVH